MSTPAPPDTPVPVGSPKIKTNPALEPSEEEIKAYARHLGIDPVKDFEFLYLAKRALEAPLPKPWRVCLSKDKGQAFYYNAKTRASQWEHPMDDFYRLKFHKHKARALRKAAERKAQQMDRLTSPPPQQVYPTTPDEDHSPYREAVDSRRRASFSALKEIRKRSHPQQPTSNTSGAPGKTANKPPMHPQSTQPHSSEREHKTEEDRSHFQAPRRIRRKPRRRLIEHPLSTQLHTLSPRTPEYIPLVRRDLFRKRPTLSTRPAVVTRKVSKSDTRYSNYLKEDLYWLGSNPWFMLCVLWPLQLSFRFRARLRKERLLVNIRSQRRASIDSMQMKLALSKMDPELLAMHGGGGGDGKKIRKRVRSISRDRRPSDEQPKDSQRKELSPTEGPNMQRRASVDVYSQQEPAGQPGTASPEHPHVSLGDQENTNHTETHVSPKKVTSPSYFPHSPRNQGLSGVAGVTHSSSGSISGMWKLEDGLPHDEHPDTFTGTTGTGTATGTTADSSSTVLVGTTERKRTASVDQWVRDGSLSVEEAEDTSFLQEMRANMKQLKDNIAFVNMVNRVKRKFRLKRLRLQARMRRTIEAESVKAMLQMSQRLGNPGKKRIISRRNSLDGAGGTSTTTATHQRTASKHMSVPASHPAEEVGLSHRSQAVTQTHQQQSTGTREEEEEPAGKLSDSGDDALRMSIGANGSFQLSYEPENPNLTNSKSPDSDSSPPSRNSARKTLRRMGSRQRYRQDGGGGQTGDSATTGGEAGAGESSEPPAIQRPGGAASTDNSGASRQISSPTTTIVGSKLARKRGVTFVNNTASGRRRSSISVFLSQKEKDLLSKLPYEKAVFAMMGDSYNPNLRSMQRGGADSEGETGPDAASAVMSAELSGAEKVYHNRTLSQIQRVQDRLERERAARIANRLRDERSRQEQELMRRLTKKRTMRFHRRPPVSSRPVGESGDGTRQHSEMAGHTASQSMLERAERMMAEAQARKQQQQQQQDQPQQQHDNTQPDVSHDDHAPQDSQALQEVHGDADGDVQHTHSSPEAIAGPLPTSSIQPLTDSNASAADQAGDDSQSGDGQGHTAPSGGGHVAQTGAAATHAHGAEGGSDGGENPTLEHKNAHQAQESSQATNLEPPIIHESNDSDEVLYNIEGDTFSSEADGDATGGDLPSLSGQSSPDAHSQPEQPEQEEQPEEGEEEEEQPQPVETNYMIPKMFRSVNRDLKKRMSKLASGRRGSLTARARSPDNDDFWF